MKEASFAIEKKSSKWEHEVVWYLIDDINKATNFLETTNKHLEWEYLCACDSLKLAVGNVQSLGKLMNNSVVQSHD